MKRRQRGSRRACSSNLAKTLIAPNGQLNTSGRGTCYATGMWRRMRQALWDVDALLLVVAYAVVLLIIPTPKHRQRS